MNFGNGVEKNEKNDNNEKYETCEHNTMTRDEALTTRQAAKVLGVSVRTIQLWAEAGALTAWKTPGGHRRISRASVNRLLDKELQALATDQNHEPRILVVEDDEQMQSMYQGAFDNWRLPFLMASNGFEGLLLIGKHRPALIITDLLMPGMDGFEMIRTLVDSADLTSSLMLVVTGLSKAEIAAKGGLPPELPVLHKPIELDLLHNIVLKQLSLDEETQR